MNVQGCPRGRDQTAVSSREKKSTGRPNRGVLRAQIGKTLLRGVLGDRVDGHLGQLGGGNPNRELAKTKSQKLTSRAKQKEASR